MHAFTLTHAHAHTHTHSHTHTHAHAHTYTHAHAQPYTHTCPNCMKWLRRSSSLVSADSPPTNSLFFWRTICLPWREGGDKYSNFNKHRCTPVMNTMHTLEPGMRGWATFSSIWAGPRGIGQHASVTFSARPDEPHRTHLLVVQRQRLAGMLIQHLLHALGHAECDECKAAASEGEGRERRGGEGATVTSRPWKLASPAQPGRQSTHRPRTPLSRFTWHSRTSPNGSASWRSSSAGRAEETAHTLASPPLSPSSLAHLQSPCCAVHSRTPCWEGKRARHPSTQHAAHHVRQTGLTKTLPSGRSSPRPPASRPRLCRSVPPPPCSPAPPPLHSAPAPPRAADQWIPPLLLRA